MQETNDFQVQFESGAKLMLKHKPSGIMIRASGSSSEGQTMNGFECSGWKTVQIEDHDDYDTFALICDIRKL